jgi:hypothetical protein
MSPPYDCNRSTLRTKSSRKISAALQNGTFMALNRDSTGTCFGVTTDSLCYYRAVMQGHLCQLFEKPGI